MLEEISAGNLEETIRDLVRFGTRHTLSSRSNPERGIGAATAWVVERFEEYAASTSLTVETQTFVQPPGCRNPEPVELTNVITTLRGAQPESAGRVYVVSGHLDSRCGDPLDFTSDAPAPTTMPRASRPCWSSRGSCRRARSTRRSYSRTSRARSRAPSARRSTPSRRRPRASTSPECFPTTRSGAASG